jgi:hypothetical protein
MAAVVLSMVALCNCAFVKGEHNHIYQDFYYSDFEAGLWSWCLAPSAQYADEEALLKTFQDDLARRAAVAFGMLALLVGIIATAIYWSIVFNPLIHATKWIVVFLLVTFAFMSQLVTLSLFGTEYCHSFGCKLAWGGIVSVSASALWFVSAIGIVVVGTSGFSAREVSEGDSIARLDQSNVTKEKIDDSEIHDEISNTASASTIDSVDI